MITAKDIALEATRLAGRNMVASITAPDLKGYEHDYWIHDGERLCQGTLSDVSLEWDMPQFSERMIRPMVEYLKAERHGQTDNQGA